jgi:hypothetical protein
VIRNNARNADSVSDAYYGTYVGLNPEQFSQKSRPLLDYGTIKSDATMEYETLSLFTQQ